MLNEPVTYADRTEAGRALAERLVHLWGQAVVVLGLPRGGVPVAAEVARALGAPLDVIVVRKLGVPFQPELAMGAIGEDGVRVLADDVIALAGVSEREVRTVEVREREELTRRVELFRAGRPRLSMEGRTVVIVDDGIATGSTARAACRVARAQGAARIVVAVPVAPPGWTEDFAADADEVISLETPEPFLAVGRFYRDFSPITDAEVAACLARAWRDRGLMDADVVVPSEGVELHGHVTVPEAAIGIVAFAHGSGSGRYSPGNRYVAEVLQRAGIGTVLFDLLTEEEELDRDLAFDVELLAGRLGDVTDWLREHPALGELPVGYFGASTGAAAAIVAASEPGSDVRAVVSRGGRPDLGGRWLGSVRAPVLLLVGGDDEVVLELNRRAREELRCESELVVIPGGGHLFEEPGTLQAVAEQAAAWFVDHLGSAPGAEP